MRFKIWVYAFIGIVTHSPVDAVGQDRSVQWVREPDPDDVVKYTPHLPSLLGLNGQVSLRCEAAVVEGRPENCKVINAFPPGMGYEEAARLVAATGVVRPAVIGGETLRTTFISSISFKVAPIPSTDLNDRYTGPEPGPESLALARILVLEQQDQYYSPDWKNLIDQLDDDRKEIVSEWLDELLPIDPQRAIEEGTIQVARSVPLKHLRRYISDGAAPPQTSVEVWDAAGVGLEGNDLNPRVRELLARYCARWPCSDQP